MHVLIAAATDFGQQAFGGIASYVQDLSATWGESHKVTLLGVSTEPSLRKLESGGPILLRRSRMLRSNRMALSAGILAKRHQVRALSPDVLYAHSPEVGLALGVSNPQIPLVLHVHGTESTLRSSHFRLARSRLASASFRALIQIPAFNRAAAIIVTADTTRYSAFIGALSGRVRKKCVRMPAMVDLRRHVFDGRAQSVKDELRLVSVGRLVSSKGMDTVLRALGLLRRPDRRTTLSIVGDGPERSSLQCLAASLGIGSAVTFTGYMGRERLAHLLTNFDIFVSGSIQEGFSMSALESLASGVPVVGFDVGGLTEIAIQGKTGAVAKEFGPSALAEAIESLVPVSPAMRSGCAEMAQHYSSTRIADQIKEVLQGVIRNGDRSRCELEVTS